MSSTYTNPSGRQVLRDPLLERAIASRIVAGHVITGVGSDSFDFEVEVRGDTFRVSGTYTWDEEGYDSIDISRKDPNEYGATEDCG